MKYIHDKSYDLSKMYCLSKTHLIVINKEGLDKVMNLQKERIVMAKLNFLKGIIGFKNLPPFALKRLVEKMHRKAMIKGAFIYKEGEKA